MKEDEKLWTTSGGEQSLRPDIEEFSTSISTDPLDIEESIIKKKRICIA
jgi:hypothetical protein